MTAAHAQHWPEARAALLVGDRACPAQKRFPTELAGVAFQQKHYPEAAAWIRRALRLDPHDTYALNFAGTTYYLMGNLPAALKYWNVVQKPYIDALEFDPNLHVQRYVLDRAFAFAPAEIMRARDLATTQARLDALGTFPTYNIALQAKPNSHFDANFHAMERNGFGPGRVPALISTFSGLPYETIYPSYSNISHRAMNVDALLRWDSNKRRAWADLSAPWHSLPQYRWSIDFDARSEKWDIRRSSAGFNSSLGSLHMNRAVLAANFMSLQRGSLQWSTGAELSRRTFTRVVPRSALTPSITGDGYQIKHLAQIQGILLRVPEHRFTLTAGANSLLARLWSSPPELYEKLQGFTALKWFPQAESETWKIEQRLRAGTTFGKPPFDELYELGVERDNDLWFRGIVATRDGRKGSGPLATRYFLSNSDLMRRFYDNGLFSISAGPLLDLARAAAPTNDLAPRSWMISTGASARLTVLGTSVVFTYGRNLRSGTNVIFATVTK